MQNLIPIQITLQAVNAFEVRKLVQDLANTMDGQQGASAPTEASTAAAPQQQYSPSQHQPQPQQQSFPPAQQQFPLNTGSVNSSTAYPPQGAYPPPVGVPTMGQAEQAYGAGSAPNYSTPSGAVPTVQTTYTMEQLAVAATPLMDAGRHAEVVQLLQQFGAQALTQLPKERYGDFATALRSMGAQI